MAKLKIYTFPDSVLAMRAKPYDRVEKSDWKFAEDMLETMYDAPGIGLAANQVGHLQRVVVVDTDAEDVSEDENVVILEKKNPIIMFNPEIVYREGKTSIVEACLSVPEFEAEIERSKKIKVQYLDIDGALKTLDAEDLRAIAIQHELDHLDGKLYIDRLSPAKQNLVKKRLQKERSIRERVSE